jgi:hypothetical protein
MEVPQSWRMRFSFRNATIVVCFLNVVTALLLLQGFLSSASSRSKISASQYHSGLFLSLFSLSLSEFCYTAVNFFVNKLKRVVGCRILLFYVLNLDFSCFYGLSE